jgi:hypothetical protein
MGRVKAKASLWKPQQKTLEVAGLWAFIKDSNQFPHPDQQIVVSSIKTMDNAASLTGMVNLKTTHIKNKDVSQWLKVLGAKDVVGKAGYPNKPWREVFQDGCIAWDGKMWDLEKAIVRYDDWLNFVNFHFLFEDHPTKMTMDMVVMSIASWNRGRMDWAKVIEENLLKQLWSQPQEVLANQLVQKYLTIVYRGIQEAGDTSTMEKKPIIQGIPEAMVNQEGPSRATQATTPTVVKKRPPPQSQPK